MYFAALEKGKQVQRLAEFEEGCYHLFSGSCCQRHQLGTVLQAAPGFSSSSVSQKQTLFESIWRWKIALMQSPFQVVLSCVRLYAPVLTFLHTTLAPSLLQGRYLKRLSGCCFVGTDRNVYTCGRSGEVLASKVKSWQQIEKL